MKKARFGRFHVILREHGVVADSIVSGLSAEKEKGNSKSPVFVSATFECSPDYTYFSDIKKASEYWDVRE